MQTIVKKIKKLKDRFLKSNSKDKKKFNIEIDYAFFDIRESKIFWQKNEKIQEIKIDKEKSSQIRTSQVKTLGDYLAFAYEDKKRLYLELYKRGEEEAVSKGSTDLKNFVNSSNKSLSTLFSSLRLFKSDQIYAILSQRALDEDKEGIDYLALQNFSKKLLNISSRPSKVFYISEKGDSSVTSLDSIESFEVLGTTFYKVIDQITYENQILFSKEKSVEFDNIPFFPKLKISRKESQYEIFLEEKFAFKTNSLPEVISPNSDLVIYKKEGQFYLKFNDQKFELFNDSLVFSKNALINLDTKDKKLKFITNKENIHSYDFSWVLTDIRAKSNLISIFKDSSIEIYNDRGKLQKKYEFPLKLLKKFYEKNKDQVEIGLTGKIDLENDRLIFEVSFLILYLKEKELMSFRFKKRNETLEVDMTLESEKHKILQRKNIISIKTTNQLQSEDLIKQIKLENRLLSSEKRLLAFKLLNNLGLIVSKNKKFDIIKNKEEITLKNLKQKLVKKVKKRQI